MTNKLFIRSLTPEGYGEGVPTGLTQEEINSYGLHNWKQVANTAKDIVLVHPSFNCKPGDWISEWREIYEWRRGGLSVWYESSKEEYEKTIPEDRRKVLLPKVEESANIFQNVSDGKPLVNEVFADNGQHSHWELIDTKNGRILWTELSTQEKGEDEMWDEAEMIIRSNDFMDSETEKEVDIRKELKSTFTITRKYQPNKDEGKQEDDTAIKMMDKAVKCLYLELPESIANDVSAKWEEVKKSKHLKP